MATTYRSDPSAGLKLYELADAYDEALAWLDEHEAELEAAGGEIPPEVAEKLDAIEEALETKIERVALMVRTLEARAEVAKSEAKRLSGLAKSYGNRAFSLKGYLLHQMRKTGKRKVEGELAKVSLVTNPPSVRAGDPSSPPADFAVVDFRGRVDVFTWTAIETAFRGAELGVPDHDLLLDKLAALKSLRESGDLPSEPGRYQMGGLVIERGQRVEIR